MESTNVVIRSDSDGDGTLDSVVVETVQIAISEMQEESGPTPAEIEYAQMQERLQLVRDAVAFSLRYRLQFDTNSMRIDYVTEMKHKIMVGIDSRNYNLTISEQAVSSYEAEELFASQARDHGHEIGDWEYTSNANIGYIAMCSKCNELMSLPRQGTGGVTLKINGTLHLRACVGNVDNDNDDQ